MKRPPQFVASLTLAGHTVDIQHYLSKPYDDIAEASLEIPALLAFLGQQRAWAVERVLRAEREWKKAEAKAYFDLREGQFVAKGFGPKMTEDALKRAVVLDEAVDAAGENYEKRKRMLDAFNETIAALKMKIDLVRSTETTRRVLEPVDKD